MSINIGPPSVEELRPRITVIGVGGAGGNAIANMITAEIEGVDFIVANTDAQALNNSVAEHRIQLGPDITQGLGAGSRPEVGRAAAEETVEEIERALEGVNMCFIAAGMGGGTGTGAAPVIAEAARRKGVLTVGVVTKPFLFEGTRRMRAADSGIDELQKHVDTLIVIPNQNLFLVAKADTTFKEAFQMADEVLQQGVRSITDLMVMPGLINLDFADVRSVMGEMGKAMMGTGEGAGENRALEAAERAIANPLLDGVSMMGAKGVIISIIGGEDMKLLEIDEAANHIRELVDPEANIIWGSAFNPDLEGKIRVSVVATGIEQSPEMAERASQPLNLSAARGPKKPVLPLPTEEEFAVDAAAAEEHAATHSPPESEDEWGHEDEGGFGDQVAAPDETAPEEADTTPRMPEPYTPSMPQPGAYAAHAGDEDELEEEEAEDDSDSGGFASLMGTRINRETEGAAGDADEGWQEDAGDYMGGYGAEEPAGDAGEGAGAGSGEGADEDALELTMEAGDPAEVEPQEPQGPQDELLLDANRLAEADQPLQPAGGRRRRMLGGGGDEGAEEAAAAPAKPSAGSTLFERMANLSRAGTAPSEEEDEEGEGSSSLRIPRFLGRQNNQ